MPPVLPCGGRRLSRGLSHPVFVTWSKLEVSFLPKLKEVLAWSWHAVKIRIPNSTHSSLHGLQCELHENTLLLIHSLSSGLKMSKVWTAASCLQENDCSANSMHRTSDVTCLGRFLVSPFSVFDLTLTVLSSFGNLRTHFVVLVQRA